MATKLMSWRPNRHYAASGEAVVRAIARRAELFRQPAPSGERGPPFKLLFGELATLHEPLFRRFQPEMDLPLAKDPRVVMLLPGFGTHPWRMRYMALQLERAGHIVKRWGLGFNLGPTEENFAALEERVLQLEARYGQKVVLIGWSLGGIFAREIAKRLPNSIAKVITMGSPFSGTPYANNAWRIYQLVTGHAVDQPPVEAQLAKKPPVETVAFWSPLDGVISPRSARGKRGERDRAIAVRCPHLGFANSRAAIQAVARELESV
jgi:pimeloyl-ACP methyl ester carboxylesterase